MNKKVQGFFGAFCVTAILIGALCGFVAVDLSTDRYMPDKFGPFFEISSITAERVSFCYMAGDYTLDLAPLHYAVQTMDKLRGLLPASPRVAAWLAAEVCGSLYEQRGDLP